MTTTDKTLTWLAACLLAVMTFALAFPIFAFAAGPSYDKGKGLSHTTSCSPPLFREVNAEGVALPITEAELSNATVTLYSGGDLFTSGTPVDGPYDTDIFCGYDWFIDSYPANQYYVFATITDNGGLTSKISVEGGPFFSVLPLMPPAPPAMVE